MTAVSVGHHVSFELSQFHLLEGWRATICFLEKWSLWPLLPQASACIDQLAEPLLAMTLSFYLAVVQVPAILSRFRTSVQKQPREPDVASGRDQYGSGTGRPSSVIWQTLTYVCSQSRVSVVTTNTFPSTPEDKEMLP